jgi:hypothetical protein
MIVGALLMLSPLCALLGTVLGMFRSFVEIAAADGQPAPQAVSAGVQTAMVSTVAGILLFLLGGAVLVISLVGYAKHPKPRSADSVMDHTKQ